MRQSQNTRLSSVLFIITLMFIFGIHTQAFASGAKLPDITKTDTASATNDGTISNTNSDPTGGTSGNGSVSPIADKYAHLDPGHEVPVTLLSKALNYFDTHQSTIKNKKIIGVIDFKQHNSKERFYIIDMETGNVEKYLVAHGKNSDPDYDGFATIFSNDPGSEMSSVGIYMTAETYDGSHGYSLRLDGLSITNSNARLREIVIHPADYVAPGGKIGRSWGCLAVEPRYSVQIIDQIKDGAVIYASNVY